MLLYFGVSRTQTTQSSCGQARCRDNTIDLFLPAEHASPLVAARASAEHSGGASLHVIAAIAESERLCFTLFADDA
jgi:hypothetical protein